MSYRNQPEEIQVARVSGDIILPIHLGHSPDKKDLQGAMAIANALGVHRQTVLRWKKRGAPIYLVGRKYQCLHSELWAWIAANEKSLYKKGRAKNRKK